VKLQADSRPLSRLVTTCDDVHVAIDGLRYTRSLLLVAGSINACWGPEDFSGLTTTHIAALLETDCDVLILGTGRRQRFPAPALLSPAFAAGRPVDIMSTAAACRTWNVLHAEGRAVAAALIIESTIPSSESC